MHAVESDRRKLADKLRAMEATTHSCMSDKLAQLKARVAAKDAQLQNEQAQAAR